MPLLNEADSIYLGEIPVDAIFVGETLAWPPANGSQPVISNVSNLRTLTVSWAETTNASAYELRRNGTLIATVSGLTYNDSGLSWGVSYTYTVVPIVFDIPGDESPASVPVVIATPVGVTPTVTGTAAAGTASISWGAVTNASTYYIYRGDTQIATTSSRTYTDTGLDWQATYTYKIAPYVGGLLGAKSSASSGAYIPYGTVGALTSSAKTYTSVTVSWAAVSGATSYHIYVNGSYKGSTSSLSYAIGTTQDTTINIRVYPLRGGVAGMHSALYYYYSGRPEQRDSGSSTSIVVSPTKVDSWRPVDGWAWLSNTAAQGYYTSSYGGYKGVIYYGSNGARDALRSALGGGTTGTNRQLNGSCTKCEVYLYKKSGVGTSGTVSTDIYRSNSTASGSEPTGVGAVTKTTASGGSGSWISIGTTHGQNLGNGSYKSLMVQKNGSTNYAQFTDGRLRLSWTWNYVTVAAAANGFWA